jgi:hypothetical protein
MVAPFDAAVSREFRFLLEVGMLIAVLIVAAISGTTIRCMSKRKGGECAVHPNWDSRPPSGK